MATKTKRTTRKKRSTRRRVTKSVITFDRSQQAVFDDPARIIGVNFHRQKGKDFVAEAKAVDSAFAGGGNWFIVSMTQRQADSSFRKAVQFAKSMKQLLKIDGEIQDSEDRFDEYDKWLDHNFTWTKREIQLPNGSRIVSLPGRDPDTLAGETGNMIWTEYALFPKGGYEHWGTLFPILTRGGYKLLLISTPRGKNTKFYEVMSHPRYSTHTCDIYRSVFEEGYQLYDANGDPYDQSTRELQEAAIADFRELYGDEAKWPREYGCEFTGDLSALITYAQLQAAARAGDGKPFSWCLIEGDNAGQWTRDWFAAPEGGRFEIGWDVARTSDLSAVWVNESRNAQPKHLRHLVVMHNTTFELQREVVRSVMKTSTSNVGVGDATGLGMDSNETLAAEFGTERWLPFTFTAGGKAELASLGITAFDSASQTLPSMESDAAFVAMDLAAVQADRSADRLKLDEGPNPGMDRSHCDIAYACFLALKAGTLSGHDYGAIWL